MHSVRGVKALYFDLATATGWAFGTKNEGVKEFGTFELRRTGDQFGPFLIEAEAYLGRLIARFDPGVIAYEAPILASHQWKGGKKVIRDTPYKLRKLYGLANEVEKAACRRKVKCFECPAPEVRLHFLGRGYPRKSEACNQRLRVRCRERGWHVKNSDEANAVAGLDYFLSLENPAIALQAASLPFAR